MLTEVYFSLHHCYEESMVLRMRGQYYTKESFTFFYYAVISPLKLLLIMTSYSDTILCPW